jgi:UDP-N-acetylglucosamine/UDP-N-acetylgalactosamine diphosphorylase
VIDRTYRLHTARERFAAHGQEHVLRFADQLAPAALDSLFAELDNIDLHLLDRLIAEMKNDTPIAGLALDRLTPASWIELAHGAADDPRARAIGEERLRGEKVAALIVAGGQGTRLGYDGPKGCFPVGPVSGCSLFAWHAAKIVAARRRYAARIPLLVLTSDANDRTTREYFAANGFFGLPEEDVIIFQQGMLPAVDFEGKLMLESPSHLALAPDGHGGTLTALAKCGVLDVLEARGIEDIFYFQVDNPMVRVLDPVYLGHHHAARSQMSSKACAKRDATEKVGVFAANPPLVGIIEYSDLPADLMTATDPDGRLRYRAGNIAIHVLTVEFVRGLTRDGLKLPYHRAVKAIPYVDTTGTTVKAAAKNGVKFETFIFDALPLAARALVLEAARSEEFSPIKNKDGEDSPATARNDLDAMFRRWFTTAGIDTAAPLGTIEIAPTFALDEAEFVARARGEIDFNRTPLRLV